MTGLERTLAFLAGKPVDHPPFHPIIMRWAARYSRFKNRECVSDSVGKTAVLSGIVAALLIYPAGMLADWLHPFRLLLWATVALLLIQSLRLLFTNAAFSNFWDICHWQTLSQNNNFDTSRKTRP
jgi:hypothetical protein